MFVSACIQWFYWRKVYPLRYHFVVQIRSFHRVIYDNVLSRTFPYYRKVTINWARKPNTFSWASANSSVDKWNSFNLLDWFPFAFYLSPTDLRSSRKYQKRVSLPLVVTTDIFYCHGQNSKLQLEVNRTTPGFRMNRVIRKVVSWSN